MDIRVVSSLGLLVIKFVWIPVIGENIQFFTYRYDVSSDFFTEGLFQLEEAPLRFLDYWEFLLWMRIRFTKSFLHPLWWPCVSPPTLILWIWYMTSMAFQMATFHTQNKIHFMPAGEKQEFHKALNTRWSESGRAGGRVTSVLCNPVDCGMAGFSVTQGVLQARILEYIGRYWLPYPSRALYLLLP